MVASHSAWTEDELADFFGSWVPCGAHPAFDTDGRCMGCGISEESTWEDD